MMDLIKAKFAGGPEPGLGAQARSGVTTQSV